MTLYNGPTIGNGRIALCAVDILTTRNAPKSSDVREVIEQWLSNALEREDILYFSIQYRGECVGQIFLHDINWESGEALVGGHLFSKRLRGKGIGTQALTLLQSYVQNSTNLSRLVVITGGNNLAPQQVALNNGFEFAGSPRDDLSGAVYTWEVNRS